MPQIRRIRLENGMFLEAPFFDELLVSNDYGHLSKDFEAHALWHYLCLAMKASAAAKANFVDENERSLVWNKESAKALFISIANVHQVSPAKMVKFWDMVDNQRRALGNGSEDLSGEYKFKYWGH